MQHEENSRELNGYTCKPQGLIEGLRRVGNVVAKQLREKNKGSSQLEASSVNHVSHSPQEIFTGNPGDRS